MKLTYSVELAMMNLARSRLRTWLTIIGIVIGVAAVLMILSLGSALQQNVQNSLSGLGANLITISPGFSRAGGFGGSFGGGAQTTNAQNLTTNDLEQVSLVSNINETMGVVSGRVTMIYRDENTSVGIKGIDPNKYLDFFTSDSMGSGRFLTSSDSYSAVIGYNIAYQYFKTQIPIGSTIQLNNIPFTVVGILAQSGTGGGDDSSILITTSSARNLLNFQQNQFSIIYAYVQDLTLLNTTQTLLTNRLINSRHDTQNNQDFTVTASQSIQQRVQSVTSGVALFLALIAAISLLVGAIGISNTMFMTVLERTRQIGIYKALGASSWEISRLFLIESSLLGLSGGIIGIIVSILLSSSLSLLGVSISLGPRGGGLAVSVSYTLIIFALIFSTVIGAAAGYFPSRQASKLNPVEALRYE